MVLKNHRKIFASKLGQIFWKFQNVSFCPISTDSVILQIYRGPNFLTLVLFVHSVLVLFVQAVLILFVQALLVLFVQVLLVLFVQAVGGFTSDSQRVRAEASSCLFVFLVFEEEL